MEKLQNIINDQKQRLLQQEKQIDYLMKEDEKNQRLIRDLKRNPKSTGLDGSEGKSEVKDEPMTASTATTDKDSEVSKVSLIFSEFFWITYF